MRKFTLSNSNHNGSQCQLFAGYKQCVTSPFAQYIANTMPIGDQAPTISSASLSSSQFDSSHSAYVQISPKEGGKLVNGSNLSIDREEEDACQTIEDEKTEYDEVHQIRKLDIELGSCIKSSRGSQLIPSYIGSTAIHQFITKQNNFERGKSSDKNLDQISHAIAAKEDEEIKRPEPMQEKEKNSYEKEQTQKKLEILKQNCKKQSQKSQGRPFGFQPKVLTSQTSRISDGKGLRIGQANNEIPKNPQSIANPTTISNRKKSILYPKVQGVNPPKKMPIKQMTMNEANLKEVTLQTSSLFNISIERICHGQSTPGNKDLSHAMFLQALGQNRSIETNQNASLNTTQQIAQLVSTSIHPSDNSNFQFTPKFFKRFQQGPPSVSSSNKNLANSLFKDFQRSSPMDDHAHLFNDNQSEDKNSSFEKLESEIMFQQEHEYNQTHQSNAQLNLELIRDSFKQTPCSKQQSLFNNSQNATHYQTQQTTCQASSRMNKQMHIREGSQTKQFMLMDPYN